MNQRTKVGYFVKNYNFYKSFISSFIRHIHTIGGKRDS